MAESPFPAKEWQRLKASDEFQAYLELLGERLERARSRVFGIKSGTADEIAIKTVKANAEIEALEFAVTVVDKKIEEAHREREEAEQEAAGKIRSLMGLRV